MQSFSANGKLLLSGEYAVLKGASALAVPCRFGQQLHFYPKAGNHLKWISKDYQQNVWFSADYDEYFGIVECSSQDMAETLANYLNAARALGGKYRGGEVITELDFPNNWGLGSSSTLVYLIARLFEVDAMDLFFRTSRGSGYDVVCAGNDFPVLYRLREQKPSWEAVKLPEVFSQAYFIHLGQKAKSAPAVKKFLQSTASNTALIAEIDQLSRAFLQADSRETLVALMGEHEKLTAELTGQIPVQQRLFPDFAGAVKSLGAWGGDFVMAVGENCPSYFREKGYEHILQAGEILKI